MADEENFEIDIYGDGSPEASPQSYEVDQPVPDPQDGNDTSKMTDDTTASNQPEGQLSSETETVGGSIDARGQVKKDHSIQEPLSQQQPTPSDSDRQAIDPGASSALLVSSISWWISDDDIRGWAHSCGYEDELKDISFKEEKRHGHSKDQVYILFTNPQAASAVKESIEDLANAARNSTISNDDTRAGAYKQGLRNAAVVFTSPATNPFSNPPKDSAQRHATSSAPGGPSGAPHRSFSPSDSGRYRGRGGMGGRGRGYHSQGNSSGGYHNNQNSMSGYGGQRGGMGQSGGGFSGGFPNRGAMNMMGNASMNNMRGNMINNPRGGVPGMMGMPMQSMGMGMGGMGGIPGMGGMNMGNMGAMGLMSESSRPPPIPPTYGYMPYHPVYYSPHPAGGFNPAQFNPAMFQQQQQQQSQQQGNAGPGNDGNPHGQKRLRPE